LEVREVEIVEGTRTRTRTRTRESPKTRVKIIGKRDLSVRVRVRVRKKQPKKLRSSVTEDLFEQALATKQYGAPGISQGLDHVGVTAGRV